MNKPSALLALIKIIQETVHEAGPRGVPEGHLYAALMTIPNFRVDHLNMILDVLEKTGKITRSNYVVREVV